jgi:hypothetical protein
VQTGTHQSRQLCGKDQGVFRRGRFVGDRVTGSTEITAEISTDAATYVSTITSTGAEATDTTSTKSA